VGLLTVALAWTLGSLAALHPWPPVPVLHARFIGNAAVEITDGPFTLLTDFPYESGAFGYMAYDPAEIHPRANSVCLFTHAHADHFAPALVGRIGCAVIGPPSVSSKVSGLKVLPLEPTISIGPLVVTPVRTDHGSEPHDSYRVNWKGLSIYFTGDTDSTAEVSRQGRLDALFITPWLLAKTPAAGVLPEAARVVIYHHRAGEKVEPCLSCLVPRQGQSFSMGGTRPDR
jgi:hypothetical protein